MHTWQMKYYSLLEVVGSLQFCTCSPLCSPLSISAHVQPVFFSVRVVFLFLGCVRVWFLYVSSPDCVAFVFLCATSITERSGRALFFEILRFLCAVLSHSHSHSHFLAAVLFF